LIRRGDVFVTTWQTVATRVKDKRNVRKEGDTNPSIDTLLESLRAQGLHASMRVQEGTNVVRIAIYKSRNGQRTGRALYVTTRATRAGLLNVTLRSRSLLRKLRAGTYVMEVRSGQSVASLGGVRRITFTVTS